MVPAPGRAPPSGGQAKSAHTRVRAHLTGASAAGQSASARQTEGMTSEDAPGSASAERRRGQGYAWTAYPVTRRDAGQPETVRANRAWWDAEAADYYAEHGAFLGDADLTWGPEGLRESEAHLLGTSRGMRVLEIGCGGAQCSRWVAGQGVAAVVASDVSAGMLDRARRINATVADPAAPGAAGPVRRRCAALPRPRPSTSSSPPTASCRSSPTRLGSWPRPPGCCGRAGGSSSRRPTRCAGRCPTTRARRGCASPSRTSTAPPTSSRTPPARRPTSSTTGRFGDRVREIAAAGLRLVDVVEPEWPESNLETWAGWSQLRGRLIPGTAIFVCSPRLSGPGTEGQTRV